MPPDTSDSRDSVDIPGDHAGVSRILLCIAGIALVGNCLITSPSRFSEKHLQDHSLLRHVIDVLALGARWPTYRGIEVRNLFFFGGAAALAFVGSIALLRWNRRPRMSMDDLLDLRTRAGSPIFWWLLFLLVVVLSTLFSRMSGAIKGQAIIHFMHFAWWLPLAVLLTPSHVRRLSIVLLIALAGTASLGVWYQWQRGAATQRLQFPIGNELWLAACLLPGLFIAAGLAMDRLFGSGRSRLPGETFEAGPQRATPIETDITCPECGSMMLLRLGATDRFLGCSGYPKCRKSMEAPPGLLRRFVDAGASNSPPHPNGASASDEKRSRLPGGTYSIGRTATSLLALTICTVILAAAMYLTRSRSAIIGIGAGAAMFVAMSVGRRLRAATVLITLLLAGAGAWYVMGIRGDTAMGHRMHSIRARVDHEWAYALTLWMQKQVAGHGDGAYPLMTGVSARLDQLDDPIAVGFNDERSWVTHAHNEFLEILADLGAVGLIAYVGIFIACVYYAVRFVDRARAGGPGREHLGLATGLAAALVALMIEQCSDNALRQPGLPPIFLTVWACLWAVVRDARPAIQSSDETQPLGLVQIRTIAVTGILCASALGYFAVLDWRGSLAQQDAIESSKPGQFDRAVQSADAASTWLLDPFQALTARLTSARALHGDFHERLRDPQMVFNFTKADFDVAHEALRRLDQLNRDAPRFLQISRLQAAIWRDLTRVFTSLRDERNRAGSQTKWTEVLVANAADEPFNETPVMDLWHLKTDASIVDRLQWLCRLMRGGELSSAAQELFRRLQLHDVSNLDPALNGLLTISDHDKQLPPSLWRHRFSPEIYRLGALAYRNQGGFSDAVKMADLSISMYEAAGSRLFRAHAAALHESALYAFLAAPRDDADKHLARLAASRLILDGRRVPDGPMREPQGHTRLLILLAAGRESEARSQLEMLYVERRADPEHGLGDAFIALAKLFSRVSDQREACLSWVRRAQDLSPNNLQAGVLLAQLHLAGKDDAAARAALERFRSIASDKSGVESTLRELQQEFPDSAIWTELGLPDVQPLTTQPDEKTESGPRGGSD